MNDIWNEITADITNKLGTIFITVVTRVTRFFMADRIQQHTRSGQMVAWGECNSRIGGQRRIIIGKKLILGPISKFEKDFSGTIW